MMNQRKSPKIQPCCVRRLYHVAFTFSNLPVAGVVSLVLLEYLLEHMAYFIGNSMSYVQGGDINSKQ